MIAHYRTWTDNQEGTDFKSAVFTNFTKRAPFIFVSAVFDSFFLTLCLWCGFFLFLFVFLLFGLFSLAVFDSCFWLIVFCVFYCFFYIKKTPSLFISFCFFLFLFFYEKKTNFLFFVEKKTKKTNFLFFVEKKTKKTWCF